MAYASYERQFLALFAAGSINAAGTTATTFGCGLTRLGAGIYAMVLGADVGLVNDESYTFVTAKSNVGASGTPRIVFQVEDTSNLVKTIFANGISLQTLGTVVLGLTDVDLEVALYRTVTK